MPEIIRFDTASPQTSAAPIADPLAGAPEATTRNFFESSDGRFFAGIWESTRGKWKVNYTEQEFVHMLSGEAILTSEQGKTEKVRAGDSFVVPAGFRGTWESLGDVRKLYAIYE
jgi:uncharacterized cupin superfamily protein